MKPEKVLTTTEFWKWLQWDYHKIETKFEKEYIRCLIAIRNQYNKYCDLMQTPLSLEMFVPCKDGKPIEKPKYTGTDGQGASSQYMELSYEYQQAQEKVLFEGWGVSSTESDGYYLTYQKETNKAFWNNKDLEFELSIGGGFNTIETIEDLARQINLIGNDNFWKIPGL